MPAGPIIVYSMSRLRFGLSAHYTAPVVFKGHYRCTLVFKGSALFFFQVTTPMLQNLDIFCEACYVCFSFATF